MPEETPSTPMTAPDHWVDNHWTEGSVPPLRGWGRNALALAEVFFVTEAGPPSRERLDWLWTHLEDYHRTVGGLGIFGFRLALFLISWIGPILIGRLPTLRRLPMDKRMKAVDAFERSPVGMTLYATKALLSMLYMEHPDVAAELGFDGQGYHPKKWVEWS